MQTELSAKGELLLPADLLARYGLRAGATVVLEPRDDEIALRPVGAQLSKARLVRQGDDALLEAPPGAPPMTPENVKRMLEDWPRWTRP